MARATRWAALGVAAAMVLSACTSDGDGTDDRSERAAAAAERFLAAWSDGKLRQAARQTKAARPARELLDEVTDALEVDRTSYQISEDPRCTDSGCTQQVKLTHQLAGIGEWTYDTTVELRQTGNGEGGFVVRWSRTTFHPKFTRRTRLTRERDLPPRASILDRDGRKLTRLGEVAKVGVVPQKVRPRTYDDLRRILEIEAPNLRQKVEAAEPDWFVPVITLRRSDYDPVRDELLDVPGIAIDTDRWSLTPSSSWGRALLGSVGPATAETLKQAGPLATATDVVGAAGLQLAFQQRLAGTPGGSVVLIDKKTDKPVARLLRTKPKRGKPVRTTVSYDVQNAAERAVQQQDKLTALVAVKAGTGEILASAIGPGIQSYNTAFVGQYPPGSTFKTISAAALLDAGGVRLDDPARCASRAVVDGKPFRNYSDFQPLGAGATFADAFAASCNTAMVSRTGRLDDEALHQMAKRLGASAEWDLGVPAFSGEVPVNNSVVDKAAAMIGQGRVLMSPLAMATVAAAIDSGTPQAPRLVRGAAPVSSAQPQPLPDSLTADLRALMRRVVTQGTASKLNLPGEPVHAKTGTAEYDSDDPSKTHAWLIGFRGDLAFAVLVDKGESGSTAAAPVARRFLEALG